MELMTKWHELYKLWNSRAVFSCSKAFKGREEGGREEGGRREEGKEEGGGRREGGRVSLFGSFVCHF